MRKIWVLILCFFTFMGISFADNKYDANIYLKVNGNKTKNIVAKKGETISADIYFEAKDFKAYALLLNLSYDKKKLELVDVKGDNNFDVTSGDSILADRIEIPKKDNNKIITLKFKVISEGKSKIGFNDIKAANTSEQISIDNFEVNVSNKGNGLIIYVTLGGLIIIGVTFILKRNIKSKKNK